MISYHGKVTNKHSFAQQCVHAMGKRAPHATEGSSAEKHQHRTLRRRGVGKPVGSVRHAARHSPPPLPKRGEKTTLDRHRRRAGGTIPSCCLSKGGACRTFPTQYQRRECPRAGSRDTWQGTSSASSPNKARSPLPPPALQGDERKRSEGKEATGFQAALIKYSLWWSTASGGAGSGDDGESWAKARAE